MSRYDRTNDFFGPRRPQSDADFLWRVDPTLLSDAILDRVIHRAHPVALTGPSRRKEAAPPTSRAEA